MTNREAEVTMITYSVANDVSKGFHILSQRYHDLYGMKDWLRDQIVLATWGGCG